MYDYTNLGIHSLNPEYPSAFGSTLRIGPDLALFNDRYLIVYGHRNEFVFKTISIDFDDDLSLVIMSVDSSPYPFTSKRTDNLETIAAQTLQKFHGEPLKSIQALPIARLWQYKHRCTRVFNRLYCKDDIAKSRAEAFDQLVAQQPNLPAKER